MRLVYGRDAEVAEWVASRIAHAGTGFGPCAAIGIAADDGTPLGGAVFTGYRPQWRSIEISFALDSKRALSASFIRQILTYPFGQLDCQRVTAVTPRKARPARQFLEKLGFKREGVARRGFGDFGDAVIYGMLKRDWEQSRFHGGVGGQKPASTAARTEPHGDHPGVAGG